MGSLADIYVRIMADDKPAKRAIAEFKTSMERLGKEKVSPKVSVDTGAAEARIQVLKARLTELQKNEFKIPFKLDKIDAQIQQAKQKILELTERKHEVKISAQGAIQREIERAQLSLEKLERRKIEIPIQLERTTGEIAKLQAELAQLDRKKVRIPILLDIDAKAVQQTSAQLAGLLKLPALAQAASLAAAAAAQLGAGLFSVASAAAPAAASAAAGAGALLALGQGAGVAKISMIGIADAFTALTDSEAASTASASAASAAREAAADRISSAQKRVADAVRQANRTQIDGARSIKSAEESVAEAKRRTEEVSQQGARSIKAAEESMAEARRRSAEVAEQGAERVLQAEDRLVDAQRAAKNAQDDLSAARRDAKQDLDDLQMSLQGAALSEEGAALGLRRAQLRLAEMQKDGSRATTLDLDEAKLAVKEAQQRIVETQTRHQQLAAEVKAADAAGVEGAARVLSAKERVAKALEDEQDAQKGVAQAQKEAASANADAARSQQKAEEALTLARQQAAQANVDAARSQQKAEQALAVTREQAAQANADAARNVAEAQLEVSKAQRDAAKAMETQSAAANKLADAMSKISPQAREFVKYIGGLKPALQDIQFNVQDAIFSNLKTAVGNLLPLLPVFNKGLTDTAGILGKTAVAGSEMLASGPWKADFGTMLSANNSVLETFGKALLPLVDNFRNLGVAIIPITQRFADFILKISVMSKAFIEGKRNTGELTNFFNIAGDTAAQLGRIVWNLIATVGNLGKASYESGKSLLDSFEGVTKKLREVSGSTEGQNKLKEYFENSAKTIREVGKLIGDVSVAFAKLGQNENIAPLVEQMRTELLPAVEGLFNSSSSFGPQVIDLLTTLAGTFERLTSGGGALSSFVGTLNGMAGALNAILDSPIGPVVNDILKLAGAAAALRLVAGSMGRVASSLQIVGGPMAGFGKSLVSGKADANSFSSRLGKLAHGPIAGFGKKLKDVGAEAGKFAAHLGKSAGEKIASFKQSLIDSKDEARKFGTRLADIAKDQASKFKSALVAAKNEAGKLASRLGGVARSLVKTGAHWMAATAKVIAHTAAIVAQKAVQLAIAGATKAWAAAQWLLNAALSANPIGLIVIGLLALGAGLYTAYKKSETFRDIVNGAFDAIKKVAGAVVDWFTTEIPKVWEWVRTKTEEIWNKIYNFLEPFFRVLQGLFELYTGIWSAIFSAVWDGIKWVTENVFNGIKWFIETTLDGIKVVWEKVWNAIKFFLEPLWDAIKKIVSGAFDAVRDTISTIGNKVGEVWSGIWDGVKKTAEKMWDSITDKVQTAMDKVRSIISTAKDLIGKAWDGVIGVVKSPISNLFGWINDNLIHKINGITGKFTKKLQIDDLPRFAQGGVVPGYAPGRDTVAALVSPGEGWLVPEAVQGLARSMGTSPQAAIQSINSAFTSRVAPAGIGAVGVQQMWGGGVIDNILGKTKSGVKAIGRGVVNTGKVIYNAGKGAVDFGVDIFQDGVRIAAEKILGPLRDLMRRSFSGQGILVDTGVEAMVKVIDAVTNWGKDMDAGGAGGPAAPGRVGDWIRKAISFAGFPAGWAGPMQTLVMRESGGNPNAINLWDSNAKAGIPSGGLAQVIGPTFQAYRDRRLANNVFDPIANLVASMNYIKSRYGSIFHVQQANANLAPKGYDAGGILGPGQTGINLGSKPERILTPGQTESFERLVAMLESGQLRGKDRPAINATINVERRERRIGYDVADALGNLALEHSWAGV
jgi:SLT domain-containing protein/phage-related protein